MLSDNPRAGDMHGTSSALRDHLDPAEALRFLAEAGRALAASLDYQLTLNTIARLVVGHLADWCSVDILDGSTLQQVVLHHADAEKVAFASRLRASYPYKPDRADGLAQVLRTGQPVLYEKISDQVLESTAQDEEHLRQLRALGLRSGMIVPLVARGRTLGAITLVTSESERYYGRADLALANELAQRAALAVDNARLYEEAQREIADRKRVEQSLRESEGRLRAVVDTAVDGIITIDERGTINSINPAVERIFGYTSAEIVGQNVKMLMPDPYQREHDTYLANYQRTRVPKIIGIGREVLGRRKDGGVFPLYLGVSETQVAEGRIFTGIVHDISDRKAAEESLARQAAEMEQQALELARSNAELEEFASIVSHDLRSPLVTISGSAAVLEKEAAGRLGDDAMELITFIRRSAESMSGMIASLLSYARVGAGGGGLKVSACDCAQVVKNVIQRLKSQLDEQHAVITWDTLPMTQGDENLLAQLFQNLIENAVKYRGADRPRVHLSAQTADTVWVFEVRDNGIGIDPKDSLTIFEAFTQLHAGEGKYPGVGLGLATCKKIVERHGGRIWVESQPGQGATFTFTLPR